MGLLGPFSSMLSHHKLPAETHLKNFFVFHYQLISVDFVTFCIYILKALNITKGKGTHNVKKTEALLRKTANLHKDKLAA